MDRGRRERILEWVHSVLISTEEGELRPPNAEDVAREFGLSVSQAGVILRSDPHPGMSPELQAMYDAEAVMLLRKGLIPAAKAAQFLGVSERTIRRYVEEGCTGYREANPHGGRGTLLVRMRDVHAWRQSDGTRYLDTPDVHDPRPIDLDSPPCAARRRRGQRQAM